MKRNITTKHRETVQLFPAPHKSLIRWKNTGGSFHIGGRIIKHNEVFQADREDLPDAFMDTLIPLDAVAAKKDIATEPSPTSILYNLQHRGGGWYDVVDKNGKAINEKAMKKEDAEELIDNL